MKTDDLERRRTSACNSKRCTTFLQSVKETKQTKKKADPDLSVRLLCCARMLANSNRNKVSKEHYGLFICPVNYDLQTDS